ncbi:MAG: hypothetical protein U5R14_06385 [Gemmatimonadota bacterium]|nr:hypothetical protein [Gemmatimonadota bacterium]
MTRGSALVRVGMVLVAYGLGVLLILPLLDTVQRVLFLPPLFDRLARGGLVVGAAVAATLAWRYPELGEGSD